LFKRHTTHLGELGLGSLDASRNYLQDAQQNFYAQGAVFPARPSKVAAGNAQGGGLFARAHLEQSVLTI
jgi:hypothetical protein